MLKRNCCELNMELTITPIDPILIKSGYTTVSGPSMSFVRTYNEDGKEEVFLPGSSLKGVIRSHAERICRTLKNQEACMPYLTRKNKKTEEEKAYISCGDRFDEYKKKYNVKSIPSPRLYKKSCPTCRIFGSTYFVGRFSVSDAYAEGNAPKPEPRDGIAIDRFTGGTVPGAKFDMEVVTSGSFTTHITGRNFELWQLGLLGSIMMDFEDGMIHVGAGKSRGFGRVKAEIKNMTITYYDDKKTLRGLDAFLNDKEKDDYGVFVKPLEEAFDLGECNNRGLQYVYDVTNKKSDVFNKTIPIFSEYMKQLTWNKNITEFVKGGYNDDS